MLQHLHSMKPFLPTLFGLLLSLALHAAEKEEEKGPVRFEKLELKGEASPGSRLMAVFHFKIQEGYHTQSHKPSEEYFIPTVIKLKTPTGIRTGRIAYPEGHEEKVVGLEKPMSVYDEKIEIQVPLALSAQASLPAELEVELKYQACQGAVCFPPKTLKFPVQLNAGS